MKFLFFSSSIFFHENLIFPLACYPSPSPSCVCVRPPSLQEVYFGVLESNAFYFPFPTKNLQTIINNIFCWFYPCSCSSKKFPSHQPYHQHNNNHPTPPPLPMFVQRMKNDPKFAAKMIELQKNISQADDPINAPQTYFNQNDSLQLDTRDTTDNSDKIVDGTHTTSELADLAAEGINHRQQQEDLDLHPRSAEINVIAQVSL